MDKLLDTLEQYIREARKVQCPYVGIFQLEELLAEYGRVIEEDD